MPEEIRVGVDGWVLESYYWREADGVGVFYYYNLGTRKLVRVKRSQLTYWTPARLRGGDDGGN